MAIDAEMVWRVILGLIILALLNSIRVLVNHNHSRFAGEASHAPQRAGSGGTGNSEG